MHIYISEENKGGLAVAHFTEGNLEMIQPVKVTDTHVIIDIQELSVYGIQKCAFCFKYMLSCSYKLFTTGMFTTGESEEYISKP